MFFKKRVQISHVGVITIAKNWMKVEHVQRFAIKWMRLKLSIFLKCNIQFSHFHLIESI